MKNGAMRACSKPWAIERKISWQSFSCMAWLLELLGQASELFSVIMFYQEPFHKLSLRGWSWVLVNSIFMGPIAY